MTEALRPASPADAEAIAALHAAIFTPGECWDADTFASQLALPGVFGFFRPQKGLILARVAADEAEILTIGVLPAARGGGLGRALLQATEDRSALLGARKMFLEVAPANHAARRLYAKAGYSQVGVRRKYYADGSDALLLGRTLIPGVSTPG